MTTRRVSSYLRSGIGTTPTDSSSYRYPSHPRRSREDKRFFFFFNLYLLLDHLDLVICLHKHLFQNFEYLKVIGLKFPDLKNCKASPIYSKDLDDTKDRTVNTTTEYQKTDFVSVNKLRILRVRGVSEVKQ
jgi:hypothetical protein